MLCKASPPVSGRVAFLFLVRPWRVVRRMQSAPVLWLRSISGAFPPGSLAACHYAIFKDLRLAFLLGMGAFYRLCVP